MSVVKPKRARGRRRRNAPWRFSRYPWPWAPANGKNEKPYQQALWGPSGQEEGPCVFGSSGETFPLPPETPTVALGSVSVEERFDLSELVSFLSDQQAALAWDVLLVQFSALPPVRRKLLAPLLVRVRALAPQCPPSGTLLFTPICLFSFRPGLCDLCGSALNRGSRWRCVLCVSALRLLLGQQTLEAWLLSEALAWAPEAIRKEGASSLSS